MQEEFRKIKDFENYEISNLGNVKNDNTGKLLKPTNNGNGYYKVILSKGKLKQQKFIHRLVAEEFIQNPENKHQVDHIDNNRQNNNISNLRWVSCSENNFNKSLSTNSTSGIKGISFHKKSNKWNSYISCNGKRENLGYFDSKENAMKARIKASEKYFKEFQNKCEKNVVININANNVHIAN